jgi:transporter family protein
MTSNWLVWTLSSAVFAALASIFAKIGLEGIDSDFATLVPAFVITVVLASLSYLAGKWSDPFRLSS